jgi:hypothetical protein
MDNDDYFKDFVLKEYRFIVVNNIDNPIPLVWNFKQTMDDGEIQVGYKKLRDPEIIGRELTYYLNESPQVPLGIELTKPNNIEKWFENRK